MMARYASYEDLAEIIRHKFTDASETLRELFCRLVFNILSGNTDDHARNHAAFWDGKMLTLTPAYDICPQARTGNEASQAMLIFGDNRMSRISACLEAAHHFLLSRKAASEIVTHQIAAIGKHWHTVCKEAELTETDRNLLWGRQYLNPFAFDDLEGEYAGLAKLADEVRAGNKQSI
jgi:serine/threonine-protein kinase HipA